MKNILKIVLAVIVISSIIGCFAFPDAWDEVTASYQIPFALFFFFSSLYIVGGKEWFLAWFKDFTMLFSKQGRQEFIKEKHHLHFLKSSYYSFTIVGLLYWVPFMQFATMELHYLASLFMVLAFIGNAYREQRQVDESEKFPDGKSSVKFSFRDCRFGAYGGGWGAVAAVGVIELVLTLIK